MNKKSGRSNFRTIDSVTMSLLGVLGLVAAGCSLHFPPTSVCGDGVVIGNEGCDDGNQEDGDGCSTQCKVEKGWACAQGSPTVCHTMCGDNMVVGSEECDGTDLGGQSCQGLGLGDGDLACSTNCRYDTSACSKQAECGNGVQEHGEECDGADLGGATCEGRGYVSGMLGCTGQCRFDETQCVPAVDCGNGQIDTGEQCDGVNLAGATCESRGYYGGTLGCMASCTYDESDCAGSCGDGVVNGNEVCDGAELDGNDCTTIGMGYQGGSLACNGTCEWDRTGCSGGTSLTWITITGGPFEMGSMIGGSEEQPVHSVTVPGFEMTKSEVTVTQYGACVTAGSCTAPGTGTDCNWNDPGYEEHPVNCVDWGQAVAFCTWAGGRLPSEAEWEYAARSGGQSIEYPWGNDAATCSYAVMDDGGEGCGTGRTMSVCSKPAGNTAQGQELCDMAGNVYEWVQDWYHDTYTGAPSDGSAWVSPSGSTRVLRSGGFFSVPNLLRAAGRDYVAPSFQDFGLGFRCAR
ncbi:MAG: SUMF1/EgtB/PvdO family nonheme iron enzyme [Deltaproteobacteria bacterium]|nr:SUMF1/EgtB/PvdO family nonheme iron enzyme [Deltaproteobacteria bacterium]